MRRRPAPKDPAERRWRRRRTSDSIASDAVSPCRHPPFGRPALNGEAWRDVAIVAALVVANGAFSLAEFAVVNARRPRLEALVEAHRAGASAALALSTDAGRFLSAVQVGITLVSILTGIYTGASLGTVVAAALQHAGVPHGVAGPAGSACVVTLVTFATVVAGELVPKRLALRSPEGIACAIAPAMTAFARLLTPAVALLSGATALIFRVVPASDDAADRVTDHEIHALVAEAADAGVIEPEERHMISGVMRLGDRPVRAVMTPRADVEWLDASASDAAWRGVVATTTHAYVPVCDGSVDAMLGVVRVSEVLQRLLAGDEVPLRALVRTAPALGDSADALDALAVLRDADVPVALLYDEWGHFEGLATPANLLAAIVGGLRSDGAPERDGATRRDDGAWEIAGWLPVDELGERLGLTLPAKRDYTTAAGLILSVALEVPVAGDRVRVDRWEFEVVEVRGRRIERLLAIVA